jgi:hypothetical protein
MASIPSVVVCGKIRDAEVLARDIDIYEDWLSKGAINRIVFSGWLEDGEHALIRRFVNMGAKVVLSHPPVIGSHGHVLHQVKALHYALQHLHDDELVLRSRTDKVFLNFDPIALADRWHTAPAPLAPSPYLRRIVIIAALPAQPFFFNDMMMLGRKADLAKMVSFDLWPELEHALLNPEQQFHFQPYHRLDMCAATAMFLRVNPGIVTGNEALARAVVRFMLAHDIYLRALAEGLLAHENHYVMGFSDAELFLPPPVDNLLALYDLPLKGISKQLGLNPHHHNLDTQLPGAMTWLLDQPISPDDPRTLRQISLQPGVSRTALETEARQFAEAFGRAFPDFLMMPKFPFDRDGIHIIPPRIQTVRVN